MVFGRKRAAADAGDIGLRDANDAVDPGRGDTGARASAAGGRARTCHERVGPVVDIQHGPLRAFEEDSFAGAHAFVQQPRRIAHERPDPLGDPAVLLPDLFQVEVDPDSERLRQDPLVLGHIVVQRIEDRPIQKIGHPDAAAADLILVAGANPAGGGPDRYAVRPRLAHLLHHPVEGEDHVRPVGDVEPAHHVEACLLEHLHLVD